MIWVNVTLVLVYGIKGRDNRKHMAEVLPFQGVRFNTDRITDPENVIAPPYDVIYQSDRITLEKQHPNNIVRLILSQPTDQDTDQDNQYTRAANSLRKWLQDGILLQDSKPCYYIYDQDFITPDGKNYTRRALVAVGKLHQFADRVILPHEKTLAAPKADRLNLMRQTHAQLSPIFLLYSDQERIIEQEMEAFTQNHRPLMDLSEKFGSTHRVWKVDDITVGQRIRQSFVNKSLLIADGHHRYETALAFRDEMKAKNQDWSLQDSCNYVMMNLVCMESDGLAVLPINRLLHNLDPAVIQKAQNEIISRFELQVFGDLGSLKSAQAKLAGVKPSFGYYTGGSQFQLIIAQPPSQTESSLNRLDIKILHDQIIKNIFGVDTTVAEDQKKISYKANTEQAIESVASGEFQVAILPNPTSVSQVYDVALEGETMPQKSTFFYPKLATGIAIHLIS